KESAVINPLPVVPAHARIAVAHDEIDRHGITCSIRNSAENVPQAVESEAIAVEVARLQQVGKAARRIIGTGFISIPYPAPAVGLQEDECRIRVVLRTRTCGNYGPQCGYGFRPQGAAARDAGLRPREVDPAGI